MYKNKSLLFFMPEDFYTAIERYMHQRELYRFQAALSEKQVVPYYPVQEGCNFMAF